VGIAETGNYGPAHKHIQTQKPIVVSIEIFIMTLSFHCGGKKKDWFNYAVFVIFDWP